MLEVFDLALKRVAILENAFDIADDKRINALSYLSFSMPIDDPKRKFCLARWFVRYNGGELYRILPVGQEQGETGVEKYECEHVLSTLMDDILFGYHAPMSGTTDAYLRYILDRQATKHWVLGRCAFMRYFEYAWEQENLLAALFSVANPLSGYIWRTDTSVYPWVIHLDALETEGVPQLYIRSSANLLDFAPEFDYTQLCTRLYPLGYGEGVNQLTIKDINGGVPYLENAAAAAAYGQVSRVWIDRRYESAESLKAAAQTMLDELSQPVFTHHCGLAELNGDEPAEIGKRVRIYPADGGHIDTFITELRHTYGDIDDVEVTLNNKSTDIASTVADLADRTRIEQAYAQGATQLYAIALQANAGPSEGAVMDFYIPSEMRYVNKVLLKVQLEAFRSYSKATESEESHTVSATDGGGSSVTSESGGKMSVTSDSGGSTTQTTHGNDDDDYYEIGTFETGAADGHTHTYRTTKYHEHYVKIPSHKHDVDIPSHSHDVNIPDHSHNVTIPAHAHEITAGIFRSGNPQSFTLYVNGAVRQTFTATAAELDVTKWLIDDGGTIPRGVWHNVEVRPNDLSYAVMNLYLQGFVQSRGDLAV